MALPIKETPILTGEDARRFLERQMIPPTDEERKDFERSRKVYERMKAAGMGDLP